MFTKCSLLLLQICFVCGNTPQNSIKFLLYVNDTNYAVISDENALNLAVKPFKPLKVLCHGFATSSSIDWYKTVAKLYSSMDYNIVAIDWAPYSYMGYVKAISVAQNIGFALGEVIIGFTKIYSIKLEDVHIIGHSLGSHIAGFSGKYICDFTNEKVGRITGLDPAGPLYNNMPKNERLCDEDALFVDVLHTNAGALGILESIGHMDFYPDGGASQNICEKGEVECSHNMALNYFIKSIGNNMYEATLCDSYVNFTIDYCNNNVKSIMGDGCRLTMKGNYFLTIEV